MLAKKNKQKKNSDSVNKMTEINQWFGQKKYNITVS